MSALILPGRFGCFHSHDDRADGAEVVTIVVYDYIIIGSGAGGSAAAYRLALAGERVLLVEKGRGWPP